MMRPDDASEDWRQGLQHRRQHAVDQIPFPPPDSLRETLTPASQRILAASVEILETEGPAGLTIDKVAHRANVNRWTVRNNFGSKAALVAAAADFWLHDKCVSLTQELSHVDRNERPARIAQGIRAMILETDPRGYFLTLPLALQDETVRERWMALYRWWYRQNARWLGIEPDMPQTGGEEQVAVQTGMAHILAAIIDGLWLQVALHEESEALEPAFEALEQLLAEGLFGNPDRRHGGDRPSTHENRGGSAGRATPPAACSQPAAARE